MIKMHASVISIDGRAILLRGPSGAGKSDLALRLIEDGAVLLCDDYVDLQREKAGLVACASETIAGLIEVRGLGLVSVPYKDRLPVALACDLMPAAQIERLPEAAGYLTLHGLRIPLMELDAMAASAPARVRFALDHLDQIWPPESRSTS